MGRESFLPRSDETLERTDPTSGVVGTEGFQVIAECIHTIPCPCADEEHLGSDLCAKEQGFHEFIPNTDRIWEVSLVHNKGISHLDAACLLGLHTIASMRALHQEQEIGHACHPEIRLA